MSPKEVGQRMRRYEVMVILDPDLEERTVVEMEVDDVGPALRYATAKVTRTQRGDSGFSGGGGGNTGGGAPADDPWATPTGGGAAFDEPPF